MPGPPPVEELQRPERLQEVLKKDQIDDCLPCRLTGASAFIGLGVYSYFSGRSQLRAQQAKILRSKTMFGMKSRQAGISGIALSLVGMGVWRLVS